MDVTGKKVTIAGLGRTALALARFLLAQEARPRVSERGEGLRIEALRAELEDAGVPCETGGHSEAFFTGADIVVPSPGCPPGIPAIERARQAGADVVSELEAVWPHCPAPILAVTGSNGKTTTTELLRHLIANAGRRCLLAGNNRTPLSEAVVSAPPPDFMVLEVSSYQLELTRTFRPWIAAVLNVTPDHLDRHGTFEAYAAVKARIFMNQRAEDVAVINADDPRTAAMTGGGGVIRRFGLEPLPGDDGLSVRDGAICEGGRPMLSVAEIPLPGRHNQYNVLCALTMLRAAGFGWEALRKGLATFPGVEHRLERISVIDGVTYVNDSKSTTPESLRAALACCAAPVTLIAGGRGKAGADYAGALSLAKERVRRMLVLGEEAAALEKAFGETVPVTRCDSLEAAVAAAKLASGPGGTVLLSPACASFDMFTDFEERGRAFKACVEELSQGDSL